MACKSPATGDDGGADASVRQKPHLHAHNDFEQQRPLLDALDNGFDSIEADVELKNGALIVTHDSVNTKGTLEELYLDPLRARVAANGGSVHGDGKPLYLWIDLRQSTAAFQDAIAQELSAYDFLTTFNDDGVEQERAVTVILTGNQTSKDALVQRPAPRPFVRDHGQYTNTDPDADGRWRFYAIDYFSQLSWGGEGEMPAGDVRRMKAIAGGAHQKGRMVRFWSAPQTHAFYRVAADVGVDFIGTDNLADLAGYMRELYP